MDIPGHRAVAVVIGVVGHHGPVVEVGGQHEGLIKHPSDQGPGSGTHQSLPIYTVRADIPIAVSE